MFQLGSRYTDTSLCHLGCSYAFVQHSCIGTRRLSIIALYNKVNPAWTLRSVVFVCIGAGLMSMSNNFISLKTKSAKLKNIVTVIADIVP